MSFSVIAVQQALSEVPMFFTPGLFLSVLFITLLFFFLFKKSSEDKDDCSNSNSKVGATLTGPRPWPILGSLHVLGQDDIPFAGFTRLTKVFGDIFSIRLGNTDCVVVNNTELRDEVLIAKANDFDGRPNFERIRLLFGGDKQNALAFCDFSALQSLRREILSSFTFPHSHSNLWDKLDEICQSECKCLQEQISASLKEGCNVIDIKPIILKACANIFNRYFCASQRFDYSDPEFTAYVNDFDAVFWEVNTGRLPDFIPWMLPLSTVHILKSKRSAAKVRHFVDTKLVEERMRDKLPDSDNSVFLDSIMPYLQGKNTDMSPDKAMYALEDILGGHCAVGCIAIRILADLAKHSDVQNNIRGELEDASSNHPAAAPPYALANGERLHWTRAAIFETLRLTCSPIVPHKATRDSTIGGFYVKKGTVVFINNHELSMSEKYWKEGETQLYKPSRFLRPMKENKEVIEEQLIFKRPWHFRPFSHGKRSCMGYKMVENVCLALVAAVLEKFELSPKTTDKMPMGLLGLPDRPVNVEVKQVIQ